MYFTVPPEIEFRGEKAQLAYEKALRNGSINVYRGRILLIGQDRAGKTSLKNSLIGLPFNPNEQSTEGIQVDPSKFEVDIDLVKNWEAIGQKEGLLGCSEDVAKMLIEKNMTAIAYEADEREGVRLDENEDDDEISESEETLEISKKFEDEDDDGSMSQV